MKKVLRTKFLIEREVQMQIVGYMLIIWFISTVAMIYLVDTATSATFNYIIAEDRSSSVAPILEQLRGTIRSFSLVGVLIGMVGSLLGGIIVSHRVAGPLFALRRAMDRAVESGHLERINFRKGDFTKNLAESYNRLVDTFKGPSA